MQTPEDNLRHIEQDRIHSLVTRDLETALRLHADDFELINPMGKRLTKEQYLGGIESGQIAYQHWTPGEIDVRIYQGAAVLRYESQIEINFSGQLIPSHRYLHTDLYELQGGQWKVVWSQATRVIS
jgi:hypothetical protein